MQLEQDNPDSLLFKRGILIAFSHLGVWEFPSFKSLRRASMKKQRLLIVFTAFLLGIFVVSPPKAKAQDLIRTNSSSSGVGTEYQFMIDLLASFDQSPSDFNSSQGTPTRLLALPQLFDTQYVRVAPSSSTGTATSFTATSYTNSSSLRAFNTRLEGSDRGSFLNWFLSPDFNKDQVDNIFKDGETPPELSFIKGLSNALNTLLFPKSQITLSSSSGDTESESEGLFNSDVFKALSSTK